MTLARALLVPLATLSVAAAGIHFAVVEEHLREFEPFGYLFLALAWFQALWAIAYVTRPTTPLAWAGVAVNLGALAVWLWSRTTGLPFGPEPGVPEAAGPLDLAASAFELLLLGLVILLLAPRARSALEAITLDGRRAWLGAAVCSALVVAVASAALLAPGEPHVDEGHDHVADGRRTTR